MRLPQGLCLPFTVSIKSRQVKHSSSTPTKLYLHWSLTNGLVFPTLRGSSLQSVLEATPTDPKGSTLGLWNIDPFPDTSKEDGIDHG